MKYKILLIVVLISNIGSAQSKRNLPIIDMHLHALLANDQGPSPLTIGAPFDNFGPFDPKINYPDYFNTLTHSHNSVNTVTSPGTDDSVRNMTIAVLNKRNIFAVTSGDIEVVRKWKKAAPDRIINGVRWNFWEMKQQGLNIDSLEKLFKSGEFKVFGEVTIQYEGYSMSDTAFEPYLAMAEKLDIPVGIHIGPGPPGAPYLGFANYRAKLHSALSMEEALLKHPKLRVYAMHAGWPMLDDMIATLYTHPQLYVDLGVIDYILPKKEFYYYLERLVNAGFEKRIMFGSDNMVWPESIGIAIDNIENAPFLTSQQKRDIFFNNAARFLRLNDSQIKDMQK
jgi:predicted TIM-barrel fold metal-dependent hydrolase